MNPSVNQASEIMWRKINNRLRQLKRKYGNRKKRDIWSWLDYQDFTCYWYNNEWVPDYIYHKVIQDRVNNCLDKILKRGIFYGLRSVFLSRPWKIRALISSIGILKLKRVI